MWQTPTCTDDHISGGRLLAERTGARYYLPGPDAEGVTFPFRALEDGQQIRLGLSPVRVQALGTPGHTHGSVCLWVGERYLLTGDTLFLGSVGRPDLAGQAGVLVCALYRTLREQLGAVPDEVVILPGHVTGEHGAPRRGAVLAPLGDLRRGNPVLGLSGEEEFVRTVLASLSQHPVAYDEIRRANQGLAVVSAERAEELEIGRNLCAATHWR